MMIHVQKWPSQSRPRRVSVRLLINEKLFFKTQLFTHSPIHSSSDLVVRFCDMCFRWRQNVIKSPVGLTWMALKLSFLLFYLTTRICSRLFINLLEKLKKYLRFRGKGSRADESKSPSPSSRAAKKTEKHEQASRKDLSSSPSQDRKEKKSKSGKLYKWMLKLTICIKTKDLLTDCDPIGLNRGIAPVSFTDSILQGMIN